MLYLWASLKTQQETMRKQLLRTALLSTLGLSLMHMQAQAEQQYNKISFNTQVSQEVANDEIRVKLSKTTQAGDAKTLASTLNQTINQVLAISKKYPEVKVSTGHQSTYPRYNKNGSITGFTGSASLEIYSQNFTKASELIAELQSVMTIDNLNFGVSEQAKQTAEKNLRQQVIKRFQDEAQSISQAFGVKNYKIINVSLDSSSYQTQHFGGVNLRMASSKEVIPQEFEGGDSTLSYRATGTIELIR